MIDDNHTDTRLIEEAFPLEQASLDSVHEKNIRHGHISTMHVWPARRPLAACRAALLATLLPDPGNQLARQELCERIGGVVERKNAEDQKEVSKTVGGVLHWPGSPPKSGQAAINRYDDIIKVRDFLLSDLRSSILKFNGQKPPRVLDPFAGGGAIPLEAMGLGCKVWANDLNPVSVFLLRATLQYPHAMAGLTLPLPDFLPHPNNVSPEAPYVTNITGHVRAWGQWVLNEASKSLAKYYPLYAEYAPISKDKQRKSGPLELVPLSNDGDYDLDALNKTAEDNFQNDNRQKRWQAHPTIAYLWARTAICKNCRKTIPLLKTMWLAKTKNGNRVALKLNIQNEELVFNVWTSVPVEGHSKAEKLAYDAKIGQGTMSKTGVTCPYCQNIMTMDDLRREGKASRLDQIMIAVVYEGPNGKEYRLPTSEELAVTQISQAELDSVFQDVPFGIPNEPTPKGGNGAARAFSVDGYGFSTFYKLFTSRQLLSLGTFVRIIRQAMELSLTKASKWGYSTQWLEAIGTYLSLSFDKTLNISSTICSWDKTIQKIRQTFARFALPITWDFVENSLIHDVSGSFQAQLDWVLKCIEFTMKSTKNASGLNITRQSATQPTGQLFEAIVTDPPYYDSIPYSDCMDYFYVWLKRLTSGSIIDQSLFSEFLSPKWNHETQDGELIDDANRHGNNKHASQQAYENGMAKSFSQFFDSLTPNGRLVVVFAHKNPTAWESLASAIIRAGFVVTASWPIQTEMPNRTRGHSSAALSSSVWLVCRKRPTTTPPGWDTKVLELMETNITTKLREFWDAGVRGPDFIWAATGPALSVFSAHPVVKKIDSSGQILTITEFLTHVRRLVVKFTLGRILPSGLLGHSGDLNLDGPTAYYLLHRNFFGMKKAPTGACVLYAMACGLSDQELEKDYRLVTRSGSSSSSNDDYDEDSDEEDYAETGDIPAAELQGRDKLTLLSWSRRTHKNLGLEGIKGIPVPIIDLIHKLMRLWKEGDLSQVDHYIAENSLNSNELFHQVFQAVTELSVNSERSLLETISNHLNSLPTRPSPAKTDLW
jgi:adenine-specific DNA methylase